MGKGKVCRVSLQEDKCENCETINNNNADKIIIKEKLGKEQEVMVIKNTVFGVGKDNDLRNSNNILKECTQII